MNSDRNSEIDRLRQESGDANRATGRSIRIVLVAILQASNKPGEWVTIEDHTWYWRAHEHTWNMATDVMALLGIDFERRKHQSRYQIMIKR